MTKTRAKEVVQRAFLVAARHTAATAISRGDAERQTWGSFANACSRVSREVTTI